LLLLPLSFHDATCHAIRHALLLPLIIYFFALDFISLCRYAYAMLLRC